jgi:hypothetical protein
MLILPIFIFGSNSLKDYQRKSSEVKAGVIINALEQYKSVNGYYPTYLDDVKKPFKGQYDDGYGFFL